MNELIATFLKLKKKGFFHLIISNYSVQFIVFGSHLLIAKIMSPSDVGIIKTIEVFSNMAIVLGSGGAIFAILKVIPESKNIQIRQLSLKFSLKYVALFSFIIFLILNLLNYLGLMSPDREVVKWFHQYSLLIVPSVLTMILIRYYQAVDRFKRISNAILFLKLISTIFVLFFTYFFLIKGYIISMVISAFLITIVLLFDLRKEFISKSISKEFINTKRTILRLSKSAFVAQLIDQLKLHSGFFIANYVIIDRIMFGHYAFALILIQGLNIIFTTVQQFITPKMSAISNNQDLFFKQLKQFEINFNYLAVAIFVIAQLLLPFMVKAVFDNKYDDSILLLRIMIFGWLIHSLYALKGVVFISLGKMKYIAFASTSIFLISFPVMYFLIVIFMELGAAFSYLFQHLISFFIIRFYIKKVSSSE